jgi:hypothetical protein
MTATTSDNSAIATAPSALELFRAKPAVALTIQALSTSANGLKAVWAHEQETKFGRSVLLWGRDIFIAVALPLLSLIWLAVKLAYQIARKPETRAVIARRYESVKAWAAPKFSYDAEAAD